MAAPVLCLLTLLCCALTAAAPGRGPFRTEGKKTYDIDGNWVVFRGMSTTCTEYFARPGYPLLDAAYPGQFGWGCFGGRPAAGAPLQLNNESTNMMRYLLRDTAGGAFQTHPAVAKVAWPAPYDQVLSPGSPFVVPTVRMPITSGTFLYDLDANDLTAAGYRQVLDLLITNFTSQGVAVILDQHGCCGGSAINCSSWQGPMALREYGNHSGALAFWDLAASLYKDNDLVMYELYVRRLPRGSRQPPCATRAQQPLRPPPASPPPPPCHHSHPPFCCCAPE